MRQAEGLVLASASPRRAELLTQLGIPHEVLPAHIDESLRAEESPKGYVVRMAREKARAVAASLAVARPVLGADTSVVLEGKVLGKPRDRRHAARMLSCLSGQRHQVLSAVAVVRGSQSHEALQVSEVTFKPLSEQEIAAYLETGEADDKAGAYAIQGRAAAFIQHLDGSYSGVMGLPLYQTCQLLERLRADQPGSTRKSA